MKAKQLVLGNETEIVLKNGKIYQPKKNESSKAFQERVIDEVQKEYLEDIEFSQVDMKKMKSYASKVLQKSVGAAKGLFKKMMLEILSSRGIEIPEEKEAPAKKEPRAKKEVTVKYSDRKAILEEFKNSAEYKKAKKSVGLSVTYKNRGSAKSSKGVVKGLLINRTATKAYYMVLNTKTGKRDSCLLENLKFVD